MSELSSNPRARASKYYRSETIHSLEPTPMCPVLDPSDHIDSHKDKLYGMLAVLANKALEQSLMLREKRGPYGVLAPGGRTLRTIPSKRHVHRSLKSTLEFDSADIQQQERRFVSECDRFLGHLHASADSTMHPNVRLMMKGGIDTAVEVMDMTYTTLTNPEIDMSDEALNQSWRSVYDQTTLGIKELIVLPTASAFYETRSAVFTVDESNVASFCIDGLRSTKSLQNIPDRQTIGCPISFEPALVRELWRWYIDLRADVENPN